MEGKCTNRSFLVLMQTSKAIQERIRLEMVKHKLGTTEFSILEVLYLKGKQTIHQVAESILISGGSMTYMIDKLEQKGLLTRKACPNDRRAIHVVLTDQGTELMKKVMPSYQRLIDYMFGLLHPDETETLVKLLQKVQERTA